ncbi:amidohydrolase [Ruminococcaceae bacterium OttesenSCG-928-I18]|nr:amidohydrolase [Ruminococcaceae bacterium OttesenSCG-928-I18]
MATADTVFVNGKVVTVDKEFSFKQAIAIKDGTIFDVGFDSDIKPYIGSKTEVIDLKGRMILPGSHDAHMHGVYFGMSSPKVSLNHMYPNVKSIQDMRDTVAQKVKEVKPGQWIKGIGWQTGFLEECKNDPNRLPRKGDFDDITPDNPIVLSDFSLHTITVNSKALELCGINKDTPNPPAGEMERDADGNPTGVFKEFAAQAMVMRHFPSLTDEELKTAIRFTQDELNKNGVTSYNESSLGPGGDLIFGGALGERAIHIYKQMQDSGDLTARVTLGLLMGEYGAISYDDVVSGFEKIKLPEVTDPNWFEMPMLKMFVDGVPMTRTAWMLDDYIGMPGYHGRAALPGENDEDYQNEMQKIIDYGHTHGYQMGIHAVGDRACKVATECLVNAMREYPRANLRHYLIHAFSMTNDMAPLAAQYNIGMSMQSSIAAFVYEPSEATIGKLASRAYGMKELMGYGINIANGSDAPCDYPNWRKGLETSVTRKSDTTGRLHCPELAISVADGIRTYTINGAWQEHKENLRGSVEVGKVADLQVLEEDLFLVDKNELGKVQVDMTMVNGNVVYTR